MSVARGWQFFMHPGPTNIPLRVLQAMTRPAVDFTGPEFVALRDRSLERLKAVLKTQQGFVIAYSASGHGAWDASIANLFSPGDKVLVCLTGYFSENWAATARQYGLEVEVVAAPERRAVDPNAVAERLAADKAHAIKAVMLVQNETATGMRHPVADVRAAMNRARHPALYLVDTISSLASYDFRMDEWGVDLVVGGSQKGLMLPPGMSFTAINARVRARMVAMRVSGRRAGDLSARRGIRLGFADGGADAARARRRPGARGRRGTLWRRAWRDRTRARRCRHAARARRCRSGDGCAARAATRKAAVAA